MLKWIGGCLVLVVVLLAGGSWFAMRTMRDSLAPDGSARVAIRAAPGRIYASLSHGDSIKTWMAQGNTITTWRRGPLVVGDSIRVEVGRKIGQPVTWRVSELIPNRVVSMELLRPGTQRAMGVRRDSLVAAGDSTIVISKVTSVPAGDTASSTTGGLAGDMMLSMFRLQAKLEYQVLKARIELPQKQETTR
jgi:hypothetical protein